MCILVVIAVLKISSVGIHLAKVMCALYRGAFATPHSASMDKLHIVGLQTCRPDMLHCASPQYCTCASPFRRSISDDFKRVVITVELYRLENIEVHQLHSNDHVPLFKHINNIGHEFIKYCG